MNGNKASIFIYFKYKQFEQRKKEYYYQLNRFDRNPIASACHFENERDFNHLAKPKVGDLDVPDAVAAKDILRLEVAMYDSHLVQVRHALHQWVDHRKRLRSKYRQSVAF